MSSEIWKPIQEVNCLHEVSNLGNVRNTKTRQILKPSIHHGGYFYVTIGSRKTKRVCVSVHRLVAKHFCSGYKEGLVVNHIDGNKANNTASNLEWVSQSENMLHAFKTGLAKPHPEVHEKSVLCIETGIQYKSTKEASRITGISQGNISEVCNGKRNHAGGYTWKFVDHFN